MGYRDIQDGKDYEHTSEADKTQKSTQHNTHNRSLISRLAGGLINAPGNLANSVAKGFKDWKNEGKDNGSTTTTVDAIDELTDTTTTGTAASAATGNAAKKGFWANLTVKKVALMALTSGTSIMTLLSMFTGYKNDEAIKNDNPLSCEVGTLSMPLYVDHKENDKQETINVMYDIFCRNLGYSEHFLAGVVTCMWAESGLNPGIIEETGVDRAGIFYSKAGGGTFDIYDVEPTTGEALRAYHEYSNLSEMSYEPVKNEGYNCNHEGNKGVGLGLIQWTGPRGDALIQSVDLIHQSYNWYDLPYQCAFLLAEIETKHQSLTVNGEWRTHCLTDEDAIEYFFENFVFGTKEGREEHFEEKLQERLQIYKDNNIADYIEKARDKSNSIYTTDMMSMQQLLAANTFTGEIAEVQRTDRCQNGVILDTTNIAMAAVSLSWLEKADYEDDQHAYGEYRRSVNAPNLINDWDYVETQDNGSNGTAENHKTGAKDAEGHDIYNMPSCDCGGSHDLIACTEFYYYAHLIAFPKETGKDASHPGYFSSCDRGTATAIRISGSDDTFVAGHPGYQLAYMLGAKSMTDRSDQQNAQNVKLWKPSGFLRGCDYYSFEGLNRIEPGTIMVSWDTDFANGLHLSLGVNPTWESTVTISDEDPMFHENLRFPMSNTTTQRHIVTYVGGSTVNAYWGIDYLYQQFRMYNDADSLIRDDLSVQAPQIMQDGADYKASYAEEYANHDETFYTMEFKGAETHDDVKKSEISGRETEFNQKTGLPEFKAWEQIFVRLIHNSDDDVASKETTAHGEAYEEYSVGSDNYKDEYDDHIVQYGEDKTRVSKFFFEDWNSVGSEGASDHAGVGTDLLWLADEKYNNNSTADAWYPVFNAPGHTMWRYEYVTDVEYRMNQLMRFAMASMMCSYACENDAAVYQPGVYGDSGHILGNVYRRMSRIADEIDESGRYYYYNTVVSNDMLQDLVQLFSFENNTTDGMAMKNDSSEEYGSYYDLTKDGYADAKSDNTSLADRRYGLTAADIDNIMRGFAGLKMGDDTEEFETKFNNYIVTPLYEIDDTELSMYDKDKYESGRNDRGSHEGSHKPSENASENVYYMYGENGQKYAQELYGINPFLMLDHLLDRSLDVQKNNLISGGGYRSDVFVDTNGGSSDIDNRLAFIDRHFVVDVKGNINMVAYAVLGLNPSSGTMQESLAAGLASRETLKVGEGTGGTENMLNSWGSMRYTDFIYGDDKENDQAMAKRLFNNDDRDNDSQGDEIDRDDYNRREWILIPYYHTHSQSCWHDSRLENDAEDDPMNGFNRPDSYIWDWDKDNGGDSQDGWFIDENGNKQPKADDDINYSHKIGKFNCSWWDDKPTESNPDTNKLETQSWLNFDCKDELQTFTLDPFFDFNGKYTNAVAELAAHSSDVLYFTESGKEIWVRNSKGNTEAAIPGTNVPDIHKLCPGHKFENTCTEKHSCPNEPESSCTHGGGDCGTAVPCDYCHKLIPCGDYCYHPCTEQDAADGLTYNPHCLDVPWDQHGKCCHIECDEGDECHDTYGCNILEYYYHTGVPVFMAVPVVEDPVEEFDINDYLVDGKVKCDKGNIPQLIEYESNTGTVKVQKLLNALSSMAAPGSAGGCTHHDYNSLTHSEGAVTYTNGSTAPGYSTNAYAWFTVEGNIITSKFENCGETARPGTCLVGDLALIESIRVRVGIGKSESNSNGTSVNQMYNNIETDVKPIEYDNVSGRDNGSTDGYGEYIIMGAQHDASPDIDYGNYGDLDATGIGPDTAKKSGEISVSRSSLVREILGDEHVYHIRFGSQNKNVVTGMTEAGQKLGFDFKYFEEFVDVDADARYIDYYTGKLTTNPYNQFIDPNNPDQATKENQNDPLPIPAGAAKSLGRVYDIGTTMTIGEELLNRYKNQGLLGQDAGLNGDYGLWIAHASRGDRGMKTEYLVLKDWFGDPYDGTSNSKNMQYMLFSNVSKTDEYDVDGDGNVNEWFIYSTTKPDDSCIDDGIYGQGANSHWKALIDIYNETRREIEK